jgi:hypothetical protein
VFAELFRLKWISASSDAPAGFKNAKVNIRAPAMMITAEAKPSTGIYFVPIKILLSETTSTANE